MHFLNKFYDQVIVISLQSNQERRQNVDKQLNRHGIEFIFFDAVNGKELDEKFIDEVSNREAALNHKTGSRSLSKSEVGCALSHLSIYKKMVNNNFEKVLILEDDINIDKEAMQNLPEIHKSLPQDWEFLYYGVLHNFNTPLSHKLKLYLYYPFIASLFPEKLKYSYPELKRIYPRKYSDQLFLAGYHHGTHAYGITRRGAKNLLMQNKKISAPIDCTIGESIVCKNLRAYLVRNLVFIQNPEFISEVEHSGFD